MTRLSNKQMDVLQWIADGCPERDWVDFSHRISARSLTNRGLVKVRGHGPTWTAEMTEAGQAFLSGARDDRPALEVQGRRRPQQSAATPLGISGHDLLSQLIEAGGRLTVENPASDVRAAYRRALSAIPRDKVPVDQRVTFTGRDRGDLVVILTDTPAPPEPDPVIPVPDHVDPENPLIAHLIRHPEQMPVASASRDRALRLVQALHDECQRRGHHVRPGSETTLELVIQDQALPVALTEETQKAHRPPEEEIAAAKYDWQRIPARETREFNGRLVLTLEPKTYQASGWADRQRWSLESRLWKLLKKAEETAHARVTERERLQRERHAKRQKWEQSRPLAEAAYLDHINRQRLDEQLAGYEKARRLREYAEAIEHTVLDGSAEPDQVQIVAWLGWIRAEALGLDPLIHPEQLQYFKPAQLPTGELSTFMPDGMDYNYPPGRWDD